MACMAPPRERRTHLYLDPRRPLRGQDSCQTWWESGSRQAPAPAVERQYFRVREEKSHYESEKGWRAVEASGQTASPGLAWILPSQAGRERCADDSAQQRRREEESVTHR